MPGKAEESKDASKVFTLKDVEDHNKEEDVWFVVHGKIYDVSKYIQEHPGGAEIMAENAGKDVSDQFEEFFHSAEARTILKKYEIGVLEGSTEEDYKKLEEAGGGGGDMSGGGIGSYLLPLLIVLVAIFYQLNKTYKFV
eukprot:CAMPEP_0197523740 /NCGR_PEP_ID=MMETSP1318-20131121/8613_1 /TAXON_ID=552666 /ORGANISM="Partenskyella glossopodia, Strain RCC365" /LENGTH=138 /DNA_ID=CAMNT_0043076531 /DNA_START=20 /DNA_END=436 /DNA_ORIENTATION=+